MRPRQSARKLGDSQITSLVDRILMPVCRNSPSPGVLAGLCLLALGLIAGATRAFPGQDDIQEVLERAEEILRGGDVSGAERELLTLSRANPRSYIVHNNLG